MSKLHWPRPRWLGVVSLLTVLFGLITIKAGGSVLFFDGEARQAAGHYVPFVVGFNVVAGLLYLPLGIGLWTRGRWTLWLGVALTLATSIVFVAFAIHILDGGLYEDRTVIAMSVRLLVCMVVTAIAWWMRGLEKR